MEKIRPSAMNDYFAATSEVSLFKSPPLMGGDWGRVEEVLFTLSLSLRAQRQFLQDSKN